MPTTGVDDCIAELQRCAELGLRTVQLESYPSGSFIEPTAADDPFWAAAVEVDMPINIHQAFNQPVGDLVKAKELGIDLDAGKFAMILYRMIASGVFERFPDLKFVGTEVWIGWLPSFFERFDESVRPQPARLESAAAAERVLQAQCDGGVHRRRGGSREPLRRRHQQHLVGSRFSSLGQQLARGLRAGEGSLGSGRVHSE